MALVVVVCLVALAFLGGYCWRAGSADKEGLLLFAVFQISYISPLYIAVSSPPIDSMDSVRSGHDDGAAAGDNIYGFFQTEDGATSAGGSTLSANEYANLPVSSPPVPPNNCKHVIDVCFFLKIKNFIFIPS